jgi:hypothetical protein
MTMRIHNPQTRKAPLAFTSDYARCSVELFTQEGS